MVISNQRIAILRFGCPLTGHYRIVTTQTQYDQVDPTTKYPTPPQPEQTQPAPGLAGAMEPKPDHGEDSYVGSGRLTGPQGGHHRCGLRHRSGGGHCVRQGRRGCGARVPAERGAGCHRGDQAGRGCRPEGGLRAR